MADYTCAAIAKAQGFMYSHEECRSNPMVMRKWSETKKGDRMFWCAPVEDYYGGNADLAVEDIQAAQEKSHRSSQRVP